MRRELGNPPRASPSHRDSFKPVKGAFVAAGRPAGVASLSSFSASGKCPPHSGCVSSAVKKGPSVPKLM